MSTTMKKSEILATIRNTALSSLNLENLGAIQIGSSLWAIPTGEVDGLTTYAKISVTAANPTGTDNVPAFNLEEAVADFEVEKADKERKAAEKKAKHDERVAAEKARKEARAAEKAAKEADNG